MTRLVLAGADTTNVRRDALDYFSCGRLESYDTIEMFTSCGSLHGKGGRTVRKIVVFTHWHTEGTERMAKKAKASSKSKIDPGLKAVLEREPGLKTTLEQIDKTFGDGAIMPLGASQHLQIDGIQTGSLSLDMALGWPGESSRGRMIEVFGPESSGKTTLALHIGAEAQKKGGIAAIIDAEHAF